MIKKFVLDAGAERKKLKSGGEEALFAPGVKKTKSNIFTPDWTKTCYLPVFSARSAYSPV